jgi:lipopolysaccharide biosynthesis glycosyltransferase
MDIALAANERFFPGLWAALMSALVSTDDASMWTIHFIDYGVSDASWEKLCTAAAKHPRPPRMQRTSFPEELTAGLYLPPGKSSIQYARLFFPEMFSGSTVLYLDSDLLILRDLNDLLQVDLTGVAAAATLNADGTRLDFDLPPETCLQFGLDPRSPYFNTGLFLMNLDAWREFDLTRKCLAFLHQHDPVHLDQTAINAVMNRCIRPLDANWNRISGRLEPDEFAHPNFVVHYTCDKPWLVRQDTPAAWLFEKFCHDSGLRCVEPPDQRHLIDRIPGGSYLRGTGYGALAAGFALMGKAERTRGYADAASHWLKWHGAREERERAWAQARAAIDKLNFAPDWLRG